MADELPNPISRELSDAFWGAIGLYRDWGRGQPEPEASLEQRPVPISFVCELVQQFDDPMPDHILHLLVATPGSFDGLEIDRSFRSGGRCLAQLIRERKDWFNRADP